MAEKAAPYVGLIPGVGTLAGGVIGGLGGLAAGDGLGGAVKYGLQGAAGGFAGGGLRSAITGAIMNHGGGGSAGAPSGGSVDPSNPNVDMNSLYGSDTAPDASGGSGGLSGLLSGAGGYLKSALGGINPLQAGLAAAGVVNAGAQGAKANNYANQAYGDARSSYAERAGLRKQGIAGMMNPQVPDTSNLSKIRSNNPYSGLAA